MERRRLGRTGHLSTVVAFGSAALGNVSQAEADVAIALALEHGVNHVDVAPSYGEAELRWAPWMPRVRDQIFLGCKTTERGQDGAWAELHRSLARLNVERFDLYQVHSAGKMDAMEAALAPDGAIAALVRARDEGLTRFLGITGHTHSAPATLLEALHRFAFDTVMFPLNFVLWERPDYRRDAEALLDFCIEHDVGVQIIKTAARGPWHDEGPRTYATWYQPFDDQESLNEAVRFVLTQKGVATLCSPGDVHLLPLVLSAAERYQPLAEGEQRALLATAGNFATPFVGNWA